MLYIYNKPVSTLQEAVTRVPRTHLPRQKGVGRVVDNPGRPETVRLYNLDVRRYGVLADLSNGAKSFGAPFHAVSWKSDDWFTPDPDLVRNRERILALVKK